MVITSGGEKKDILPTQSVITLDFPWKVHTYGMWTVAGV